MDSPVEQAMDIGSVMPPCSDEEALTFTMELQRIVNEKELDKLKPYVGMLVESIIRAATNSASRDQWEEILEAVLKKYPTSLKGQEMKLMEVFNFEDWIIELVGTYSSLQDLAEKMTLTNTHQIQSGVKFFTQISQMDNTPIDLTDKVKQTMEVLVKKGTKKAAKNKKGTKNEEATKDKDVEVLETVLLAAQPPKDVEGMVNVMVDSLASETAEWQSLLDDLEGLYDGSYAMRKLIEDIKAYVPGDDETANAEMMREFNERWQAIGHVPFKEKDAVQSEFREAMREKFPLFNLQRGGKQGGSASGGHRSPKDILIAKYNTLQQNINTYENNIGFFSSSSSDSPLIRQMQAKIDEAKAELKKLEEQIRNAEEESK